ncbi:hypothetical protein ACI8AC_12690 [Geodermatophilus sp. SYSU D00758]
MPEQPQIHPHEYAFIGSLIASHALHLSRVRGLVRPEDLGSTLAAACYEVILDISGRDGFVEPQSVLAGVERMPDWEANGNVGSFILDTLSATPDIHNTVGYGQLVLENTFRSALSAGSSVLNYLKQGEESFSDMVAEINEVFSDMVDVAVRYRKLQKLEGTGEVS